MKYFIALSVFLSTPSYALSCWGFLSNVNEVKSRLFTQDYKESNNFNFEKFLNQRTIVEKGNQPDLKSIEGRLAFIEQTSFHLNNRGLGIGSLVEFQNLSSSRKQALMRAARSFNKKGQLVERRLNKLFKDFYVVMHGPDSDLYRILSLWETKYLEGLFADRLLEESLKVGLIDKAKTLKKFRKENFLIKKIKKNFKSPRFGVTFNSFINLLVIHSGNVGFLTPVDFLRFKDEVIDFYLVNGVEKTIKKYFSEYRSSVSREYYFQAISKYWNRYAILLMVAATIEGVYDELDVSEEEKEEGEDFVEEVKRVLEESTKEFEEEVEAMNPQLIIFHKRMEREGIEPMSEKYLEAWKKFFGENYPNTGEE